MAKVPEWVIKRLAGVRSDIRTYPSFHGELHARDRNKLRIARDMLTVIHEELVAHNEREEADNE